MSRTMGWAARPDHLGGIPRKLVIALVGAFAKTVSSVLNTTSVHNADTLLRLVRSRPRRVPLITVSNHMSTSAHSLLIFLFLFLFLFFLCLSVNPNGAVWMIRPCGVLRVFPSLILSWLDGFSLLKIYASEMPSIPIFFGLVSLVISLPIYCVSITMTSGN